MSSILRTLEFLALGLWLGSDVFLSFVVAPGAFRILPSRDQAGAMVGFALGRMHLLGVICGVVFLLARVARTRTFASFIAPVAFCVVLMIAFTVASQVGVRGWRCCGCRWVRSRRRHRIVRCSWSSAA